MIKIKYYGILKSYMPKIQDDGFWHIEKDGMMIGQVLDKSGVSQKYVGMTILVNGVRKDKSYVLKDGDTMTVMPLVAGG